MIGCGVSGGGGGGAGGYNECYFRVKDITSSTITSITCYAGNGGQGGAGNKASSAASTNSGAQGGDSYVTINFASGNPVSFCFAGGGYGGTGGKFDSTDTGVWSPGGTSGLCNYPIYSSGANSSSGLVTQNAGFQSYYGQGSGGGAGASINKAALLSASSNFTNLYGQLGGSGGMVIGNTYCAFNINANANYSCGVAGGDSRRPGNNGYNFTQTFGKIPDQGQFGYCAGSGGSGGGSSSGLSNIAGYTNYYCDSGAFLQGGIGGYGGGGGGGGSMSANGLCTGPLSALQNVYCGGNGGSGGAGMIIITFYL